MLRRGQAGDLPPGPPLPVAAQTTLIGRWPRQYLSACRRRYGDTFTVRWARIGTVVYLADPEHIREVFTGDPEMFHAGEANAILGQLLGPHSLLLLDGQEHMRERKLMLPPFHGESVRGYAEVIEQIAEDSLEGWPLGRAFPLHPRMRDIALEVILRAVIGADDPRRLAALRRALPPLADLGPILMMAWIWPQLARVGPWRRHQAKIEAADDLLAEEIRTRREQPDLGERRDVLSMLVQARDEQRRPMGDRELRDELVTLLMAGHETTATGLAWAFERLLRTPAVLSRAVEAAHAGDDEYLDAVVREILRVRPVIYDVARKLTQPAEVGGRRLPAGVVVAPAITLVQDCPRHFDAPAEFRPERFLDGSPDAYTWIPFGGGVRRCLGASLAMLEMRTVLRVVLRRARLRPADPRPERARARHITLTPARGARVVLEERRPRSGVDEAVAPASLTVA